MDSGKRGTKKLSLMSQKEPTPHSYSQKRGGKSPTKSCSKDLGRSGRSINASKRDKGDRVGAGKSS